QRLVTAGFRQPAHPADLPGGVVRGAHRTNLALADQLIDGRQSLLQRRRRVWLVQVVNVDMVGLQTAETFFDLELNGLARKPNILRLLAHLDADFGSQDDLIAPTAQKSAYDRLRGTGVVDIGGVDEVDAALEAGVDHRCR